MKIIAYNAVYSQNCKRFFVAFLQKVISDENTPNSKYCFFCLGATFVFCKKFLFIIDGKKGNFDKIKSWLTGVQIPLSYTWSQKGSRK